MRVLIAGAGDLGSRVAHLLRIQGASVVAFTRSGRAGSVAADLSNSAEIAPLVARSDAIIFTAAPGDRSEQAYRAVFIDGLTNMLAAREQQPVLFCSSTAVYGQNDGSWVDESTLIQPCAFNGRILSAAESLLRPRDIALRLGGIYGPRFATVETKSARDFARRQALSGVAPLSQHWTNRIHTADAAGAIVFALGLQGPPLHLNLVDNEPCTQQALYDSQRAAAGLAPVAPIIAAASGKRVANALLRRLGFTCRFPSYREGYASMPGP